MPSTLTLRVAAADGTPASVERLAAQLYEDLRALRLVRVDRPVEAAPDGSRTGWAHALGEVAVSGVAPAAGLAVYRAVTAFLDRTGATSVRYRVGERELEVTALTAVELESLFADLLHDADERE